MARSKKRRSSAPKTGCKAGIVSFETKRGKTIEFRGKQGPTCGPRRKPTPPPKRYRDEFARQARACKGSSRGAFLKCMKRLEF